MKIKSCHSLGAFLCVFVFIAPTTFAGGPVINGPTRVNSAGEPWTGTVRFPDLPKAPNGAFSLFCPNDTRVYSETVKQKVTWSRSATANAGVSWGPVQAGIEASLGKTIGQEVTHMVTTTYGPNPWYSYSYCIWPAYGKFKF